MKRTNSFRRFFIGNRRLLLFLALLLGGCLVGVLLHNSFRQTLPESLTALLRVQTVSDGLRGGVACMASSCFQTFCLLAILFLSGLSACGAPITFAVPLFWGVGLGMTEAYYYACGGAGVLLVAVLVLPHSLLKAAALLMGCAESLRMSLLLSGQLLPKSAHCGGLWQDFRLYALRFAVLLIPLAVSGVLDVLMRVFVLPLFPAM